MKKLSLDNITVRMYRTGFGDCFLFFFNYIDTKEKGNKKKKTVIETKRLLIDFGAWKSEEDLFEPHTGKFHSLQKIGEAIKEALDGSPKKYSKMLTASRFPKFGCLGLKTLTIRKPRN